MQSRCILNKVSAFFEIEIHIAVPMLSCLALSMALDITSLLLLTVLRDLQTQCGSVIPADCGYTFLPSLSGRFFTLKYVFLIIVFYFLLHT